MTTCGLLSSNGKRYLVVKLAMEFQKGKFDEDGSTARNDILQTISDYEDLLVYQHSVGISPYLYAYQAGKGEMSGVCRDAAGSFAGWLIEFGAPRDAIRVIMGDGDQGYGHVWNEIRLEPGGVTYEVDPTPIGRRARLGHDALSTRFRPERFLTSPGASDSNRARFQNITDITDFFEDLHL